MADPAGSFLNAFLRGATSGQNQGSGVADLNQFEQIANQNSLYNMIAGPVLGTRFNTSTWSPTQSAGVSLGQSLLGSFLSGMGKNDVANQMQAITQAMPSIYADPSAAVRPEGVDAEAFNTFAGALQRRKIERAADAEDQFSSLKNSSAIKQMFEGKANKDKLTREEEDAARKEISGLPAVTQFNQVSTALSRLSSLKDLNTSTSDIPFIYTFIQGLDGGVIKEGEKYMIESANPIVQAYKGKLEAALNGGSGIGVELKKQIVSELQGSQKSLYSAAKDQSKPRLDLALSRGVTGPEAVLPFNPSMQFEQAAAPTQQQIPPGMKLQRNKTTGETRLVPQ